MNGVNPLANATAANGAGSSASNGMMDMNSQDFLKLLTTQVRNQDPLNPTDSTKFMSQIAQLTSASGIQELQQSFESLTESMRGNQTMQAASLIGRSVTVESDTGHLPEGGSLTGSAQLPSAVEELNVTITDSSGQVVRQLNLGAQSAGRAEFSWDGLNAEGERVPAGSYTIAASANVNGENRGFQTFTDAEVTSVNLGGADGNPTLNLRGVGEVSLAAVRQVR